MPRWDNSGRDAMICDLFRDGALMRDIAAHVGLQPQRVGEILRKAGLSDGLTEKPGVPNGLCIAGMSARGAAVALEPYVSASEAARLIGTTREAVIGFWWRNRNGTGNTLAANGIYAVNPSRRPRRAA